MKNSEISKLLTMQDALRRQLKPLAATMKTLEENTDASGLAAELNRQQKLMRVAFGSHEELRRVSRIGDGLDKAYAG